MELTFLQQLALELLGKDLTPVVLVTAYIFSFAGMFLRWYQQYKDKGKPNPKTPRNFEWGYWFRDNLLPKLFGIFATIVILFISLRFPQELLGTVFSYAYAFGVGMSLDYISSLLKKLSKSV